MKNITKETLQKIKRENVRPRPKSYFLVRRSVVWIIFGLSTLFGSVASGIAIFQIKHAEWDLYRHFSHSLLRFVLLMLPYVWLIFLIGFSFFAYYAYRHTERGYRYSVVWVVVQNVFLAIILGWLLYASGLSENLETVFQAKVPIYRRLQAHKQKVWMSPRQGLLAGTITKIISQQKIQLLDLQQNYWVIDIADTLWRGHLRPVKGLKIKIVGKIKGGKEFIAEEIRPWKGKKHRGGRGSFKSNRNRQR